MPCGVVKLSHKGRKGLSAVFTVFSVILALISSSLIFYGCYVNLAIAPNLPAERAVITLIFSVIILHGLQLTLYYLIGIKVCRKCHTEAHKKGSRHLLRVWTFAEYSSVLNVVVIGTMASGVSNHIVRSMHHSFERGIRLYLKDFQWKKVIDTMQFQMRCCGSYRYSDWHKISWISTNQISEKFAKQYRVSGDRVYAPVVPWSCCNPEYLAQCFHDPIQQTETAVWDRQPDEALKSINKIGCIEVIRVPLETGFLLFILASYALLLLQILLSIISKLLYTSQKNAVLMGDPLGVAPGWLYAVDASELAAVTSATEIMNNRKRKEMPKPDLLSSTSVPLSYNDSVNFNDSAVMTSTPKKAPASRTDVRASNDRKRTEEYANGVRKSNDRRRTSTPKKASRTDVRASNERQRTEEYGSLRKSDDRRKTSIPKKVSRTDVRASNERQRTEDDRRRTYEKRKSDETNNKRGAVTNDGGTRVGRNGAGGSGIRDRRKEERQDDVRSDSEETFRRRSPRRGRDKAERKRGGSDALRVGAKESRRLLRVLMMRGLSKSSGSSSGEASPLLKGEG